jgi:hypothetical protein
VIAADAFRFATETIDIGSTDFGVTSLRVIYLLAATITRRENENSFSRFHF